MMGYIFIIMDCDDVYPNLRFNCFNDIQSRISSVNVSFDLFVLCV